MKKTEIIETTCPKCKEVIQQGAKKCKHCGADLRNRFLKNKFLTFILIIILLGIIGKSNTNTTINQTQNKGEIGQSIVKELNKESCNSIKSNMTNNEVKNILGEPASSTESEIAGLGKSEMRHYQEGFSMKGCTITFMKGKVYSKTWTDL